MTLNRIATGAAMCCAVMLVAACGGGTSATGSATASPTTATSGNDSGSGSGNGSGSGGSGGARAFPGTTGLLAQIDGKTLQVQGTDSQTAVTYSASTRFTSTVAAKLSDVVVGVCVQARTARTASGPGSAAPNPTPRAPATAIVAASVEISPAVNGKCSTLGGRLAGARPPGAAGAPNPDRTRGPGAGGTRFGGNGPGGFGAFGKVTAVNGAGFTLQSQRQLNSPTTTTAAPPTSQTVKTPAGTTYTRTGVAKANALVVGLCVTALGKTDSTGSIAATSIALRPAEKGSCASGFGGRRFGGGAGSTGGNAGA